MKRKKILHHGLLTGEFIPRRSGTDYFYFFHKPCSDKPNRGLCEVYAILVDNSGRVIFNLKCRDCGEVDALKTVPSGEKPLEKFHLSPSLKSRIKRHWWDDY